MSRNSKFAGTLVSECVWIRYSVYSLFTPFLAPLTTNNKARMQRTNRSLSPDGGTALFDTVIQWSLLVLALMSVFEDGALPLDETRIWFVLLTDGEDTRSKSTIEDACKYLQAIHAVPALCALKCRHVYIMLTVLVASAMALGGVCGARKCCSGESVEMQEHSTTDRVAVVKTFINNITLQKRVIEYQKRTEKAADRFRLGQCYALASLWFQPMPSSWNDSKWWPTFVNSAKYPRTLLA